MTSRRPQVLIKNTTFCGCDVSEKQLLSEWPRGSYTTARTVGGNKVLEFELHVHRLVDSARLMIDADKLVLPSRTALVTNAEKLRPYIMRSISTALCQFKTEFPSHMEERRITCLLCWDRPCAPEEEGWPEGIQLFTHVHLLPPRPAPPIRVDIRGSPRGNAKAKDTQWVKDRKALEAMMGPDVNEVLLMDEDGFVLEGTQTNFFAVVGGAVHTAGDGVLEGSIRKMVLEECAQAGIPVKLTPPKASELDCWEEAFLSSTSRLVLPINEVRWPEGPAGCKIRQFPVCPVSSRLLKLIMKKLELDSVEIEGAPLLH
eukprot:GGOE01000847.1.p1 GENE.GGOE01000847.1~~GGOE01000847.1.p1  ORF type:complete len:348 (+),score=55.58 GGOE01000847.1:102-1046(+)